MLLMPRGASKAVAAAISTKRVPIVCEGSGIVVPEPSAFLVMMLFFISSGWTPVMMDGLCEQQAP
jgi:hypothetical protein